MVGADQKSDEDEETSTMKGYLPGGVWETLTGEGRDEVVSHLVTYVY